MSSGNLGKEIDTIDEVFKDDQSIKQSMKSMSPPQRSRIQVAKAVAFCEYLLAFRYSLDNSIRAREQLRERRCFNAVGITGPKLPQEATAYRLKTLLGQARK